MSTQAKGMKTAARLPHGIRLAAIAAGCGYAALLASLFFRDALALVILLPAGMGLFALGVVLWAIAAIKEARSKGML